jgi:alpha-mannosidase
MEGLENDLLRLEIDPATGGIRRFVDKRNGAVLIENAPPLLQYGLEQSHPMSAWSIGAEGPWNAPNLVGLRRVQDGPHLASLELKYRMLQSDFTLTLSLRAGSPALDIQSAGTWFERGLPDKGIPALRFSVPFAVEQPEVSYEIPFGSLARDFGGVEVPALRWAWVQGMTLGDRGAGAGCLLLNDCKHGHSFDGKNLNLTLIRSSTDPDPLPEIGRHDIALALVPTLAGADAAEAIEHGRVFNHAIRTVNSPVGQGDLPARASLIECSPEGIVLDAVKQSEDGRGTILRLYECAGKETEASLALSPLLGEIVEVAETDLMEHPLPRSGARFSREAHGSTIKTTVPARGIRTLKVVFASESPLHPD